MEASKSNCQPCKITKHQTYERHLHDKRTACLHARCTYTYVFVCEYGWNWRVQITLIRLQIALQLNVSKVHGMDFDMI